MSFWLPELLSSPDHENACRRLPRLKPCWKFLFTSHAHFGLLEKWFLIITYKIIAFFLFVFCISYFILWLRWGGAGYTIYGEGRTCSFKDATTRAWLWEGSCQTSFSYELFFKAMETWSVGLPSYQIWNCPICEYPIWLRSIFLWT